MDKNERLALSRQRSTGAVITDGYQLFFNNIWSVIKRTWVLAIVYALVFGFTGYYFCVNLLPKMITGDGLLLSPKALWPEIGIFAVYVFFFLLMAVLIASKIIKLFKEHRQEGVISVHINWKQLVIPTTNRRLLLIVAWLLLAIIVSVALIWGTSAAMVAVTGVDGFFSSLPVMLVVALVVIVLICALLLFGYTLMKNALDGPLAFYPPVKGYRKGFYHEGLLFCVMLTTGIVTLLLTILFEAPAIYMLVAHVEAQKSVLLGDPNGLPDNIALLTFLAFAFSGFFQAYIHISTLFPLYYTYGKIELKY